MYTRTVNWDIRGQSVFGAKVWWYSHQTGPKGKQSNAPEVNCVKGVKLWGPRAGKSAEFPLFNLHRGGCERRRRSTGQKWVQYLTSKAVKGRVLTPLTQKSLRPLLDV